MPWQLEFISMPEVIVPGFKYIGAHKWTAYFLIRFLWY